MHVLHQSGQYFQQASEFFVNLAQNKQSSNEDSTKKISNAKIILLMIIVDTPEKLKSGY